MNRYYTVGIVEDEVIERQALRMIMEEKRPVLQVVFEAEDGNSALKMARQYQPDILIVDIQIPVEQNRCAMACQGCGAAFFFSIIK